MGCGASSSAPPSSGDPVFAAPDSPDGHATSPNGMYNGNGAASMAHNGSRELGPRAATQGSVFLDTKSGVLLDTNRRSDPMADRRPSNLMDLPSLGSTATASKPSSRANSTAASFSSTSMKKRAYSLDAGSEEMVRYAATLATRASTREMVNVNGITPPHQKIDEVQPKPSHDIRRGRSASMASLAQPIQRFTAYVSAQDSGLKRRHQGPVISSTQTVVELQTRMTELKGSTELADYVHHALEQQTHRAVSHVSSSHHAG